MKKIQIVGSKCPDVIHEENGQWYFWEETWADRQGPFKTREEAQKQLNKYFREVLGYETDEKN